MLSNKKISSQYELSFFFYRSSNRLRLKIVTLYNFYLFWMRIEANLGQKTVIFNSRRLRSFFFEVDEFLSSS